MCKHVKIVFYLASQPYRHEASCKQCKRIWGEKEMSDAIRQAAQHSVKPIISKRGGSARKRLGKIVESHRVR